MPTNDQPNLLNSRLLRNCR